MVGGTIHVEARPGRVSRSLLLELRPALASRGFQARGLKARPQS